MGLVVRPWTVKREAALAFVFAVHRRLPKVQGAMWALQLLRDGERVGVALVGNPAQEWTTDEFWTLAVLRVAVKEGIKNGCSKLYGHAWSAARQMGATTMVTYTHLDEPGTSLVAAGWLDGGLTDGGEWSRPSRPRQMVIDSEQKRRWFAPGSHCPMPEPSTTETPR